MPRAPLVSAVSVALLILLAAWLLVASGGEGGAPRSAASPSKVLAPAELGADDRASAQAETRVARGGQGVRELVAIRLLDSTLGEPLLGRVLDADGALLAETNRDGRTQVTFEPGGVLQFRSAGFMPSTLAPEPAQLLGEWTVRLQPDQVTTIEAVDLDGAPVEGVHVRVTATSPLNSPVTWRESPPPLDMAWFEGSTDQGGQLSFPLGTRALGVLNSPAGDIAKIQLVPGETARVTIARQGATLVFLDAETRAPLPGFVVQTHDAHDPRQGPQRRVADGNGELQVRPGSRELVVELTDSSRTSATCQPDARVTRIGDGYSFRFSRLLAGDRLEIRVTRCAADIQLIDAISDRPIAGRVEVQYEHGFVHATHGTLWSPSRVLRREFDLVQGSFAVGCTYLTTSPRRRLCLQVAGYSPAWIRHDELVVKGATRIVHLQPGAREVQLRVVTSDGRPFRGTLVVRDDGSGSLTAPTETDSAGHIAPLSWSGEDLTIFVQSHSPPASPPPPGAPEHRHGGKRRHLLGRVEAHEVREGAATLTLDFTPPYGSIAVLGAPADAPVLLALDLDGARHRASRANGDRVLFEGLPPGQYVVGTQRWIEVLVSQGLVPGSEGARPLLVQVEPGQERDVTWDPRWRLEEPLEGRVLCAPGMLSELALRPWYGNRAGRIQPRDDVRIYLDKNGNYHLPAGEPRPEVLLVCTANSSVWIQVLQAFEPGSDTQVALGGLRLEWEGPPPPSENVIVLYWPTDPEFDAEFIDGNPHGYALEWNPASPLNLSAVSTAVGDVRFDIGKKSRTAVPVTVVEGEVTYLRVDTDSGRPVPVGR